MQQAGNDLGAIGEYLAELEGELKQRGASLEDALAIWTGRNEQAVWRDQWRKRWGSPTPLHRYRVADGVELLVDASAILNQGRMREIVRALRQAFDAED